MINDIQYLLGSNYVCLSFKLKCYSFRCKSRPKFNLRHADLNRMRELLDNIDWNHNLTPLFTIEAWEYFTMRYSDILHQFIPLTNQRNKINIYMSFDALFASKKSEE